jgi:hypothetical protein
MKYSRSIELEGGKPIRLVGFETESNRVTLQEFSSAMGYVRFLGYFLGVRICNSIALLNPLILWILEPYIQSTVAFSDNELVNLTGLTMLKPALVGLQLIISLAMRVIEDWRSNRARQNELNWRPARRISMVVRPDCETHRLVERVPA